MERGSADELELEGELLEESPGGTKDEYRGDERMPREPADPNAGMPRERDGVGLKLRSGGGRADDRGEHVDKGNEVEDDAASMRN